MTRRPREYTTDEIQENFLDTVRTIVEYWSTEAIMDDTVETRVNGCAFSIMALLDGCNIGVPGFIVAPIPHQEDRRYRCDNGENWYPENHEIEHMINGDIAGNLHELLAKRC